MTTKRALCHQYVMHFNGEARRGGEALLTCRLACWNVLTVDTRVNVALSWH